MYESAVLCLQDSAQSSLGSVVLFYFFPFHCSLKYLGVFSFSCSDLGPAISGVLPNYSVLPTRAPVAGSLSWLWERAGLRASNTQLEREVSKRSQVSPLGRLLLSGLD